MTTRELFKIRVIELIHGLPYDKVMVKLGFFYLLAPSGCRYYTPKEVCRKQPITIGRVMKAIDKAGVEDYNINGREITNQDGSERTDDDQTDETIEKLYELIK